VFPGVEDLDAFGREEFLLDQEVDDLGAEELFQGLERSVWKGDERSGRWRCRVRRGWCGGCGARRMSEKQAVGDKSVDVGVEIKVGFLKLVVVAVGTLPKRRLFWISGAINLH
jgi:hypothetical protein